MPLSLPVKIGCRCSFTFIVCIQKMRQGEFPIAVCYKGERKLVQVHCTPYSTVTGKESTLRALTH